VELETTDRERDRTLRAGTLNDLLDTDLSRGSEPPVRSKTELPSGLADNYKRVTPWLFRQVNAPVSPTSQTPRPRHLEKAKPPSYRAAEESYPSKDKEKSTHAQDIEITATAKDSRAGTRAPTGLAWPNKPNQTAGPSDTTPNLRQSGLRSAAEEGRPSPGLAGTPPPQQYPPRYRPREMSHTPSLPPYCATGGSSAPSKEPRPQDRSRKPSSGEPRLALPDHPLLPDSAVSRIRAAYRVSNELGNAIMLQEVRVAPPVGCTRPDAASTPRVTRRFVSVTEPEGFRKVNAPVERRSGESEARQRALSKPSDYGGRNHDRKIHRSASERVNPIKVRDVSRRRALMLEEVS
jgi:hypothetical protein